MKRLFPFPFLFLIAIIIIPFDLPISEAQQYDTYTYENLLDASKYLLWRYNSSIGLISESEDTGEHWLGFGYYNTTYWLYSDNLFAMHALEEYSPFIAQNVSKTYDSYDFPRETGLFGVLYGEDLTFPLKDAMNLVVVADSEKTIIYRRHNATTELNYALYADTICYRALDELYHGDKEYSKRLFMRAYNMFDGKGLYDDASKNDGFYANYKLGLLLYTGRILGVKMESERAIEEQLWKAQNSENKGIISLMDSNGEPTGSCNVETTSLALLAYSITPMNIKTYNDYLDVIRTRFMPIIFVLVIGYLLLKDPVRKWVKWGK